MPVEPYPRIRYELPSGAVEAEPGALVMIDPASGWRIGAADGRRGDVALGY